MLDTHFDDEELRTLAFDLQVDYDALPARGKAGKTRELIALIQRSGRVSELVEIAAEMRPRIDWSDQSIGAEDRPGETKGRRRLWWGGALAGAVVLLGVAAFFLWPRRVASADGMVLVDAESYAGSTLGARVGNFWIDRYEVTNAEYKEIIRSHEYSEGEENHPVRGLTWEEAAEYCRKMGKRLPSDAEWVLAAQGPDGSMYPWGNDAEAVIVPANIYPVGNVPINRSFFGVFDTFGNVAEWVDAPAATLVDNQRLSRGGSYNQLRNLSVPIPGDPSSDIMTSNTGFRCAASEVEAAPVTSLALAVEPPDIGTDEFTSEDSNWPNDPTGDAVGYHPSDFYHLSTATQGAPATSFFSGNRYGSFVLEADLFVDEDVSVSGGAYRYGLAFRHDNGRYYAFVVGRHDQSWNVLKFSNDGTYVTLAGNQSESIDGAGHTVSETEDRLTVIANGMEMTFLIDGQIVSHVSDPDYQIGQVGFYVESLSGDLGHIHFDSLSLQALDPSPNIVAISATATVPTAAPAPTESPALDPTAVLTIAPTSTPVEVAPVPSPTPAVVAMASSLGMVLIPGGEYVVGNNDAVQMLTFWLDRYETTNAEYDRYAAATGAEAPSGWPAGTMPAERAQFPVQGVTWKAADEYCRWANKRLPTEAEWEVAARGPYGWVYPWGNTRELVTLSLGDAYEVGTIPANRSYFGAFDLAGNVSEWVSAPHLATVDASEQVLRGGDYFQPKDLVTAIVGDPNAGLMVRNAGVRCAANQVGQEDDVTRLHFDFGDVTSGWSQAEEESTYFYGYHPADFYHLNINLAENCLVLGNDLPFETFVADATMYLKDSNATGDFRMGLALTETDQRYYALLVSPINKSWFVVKGLDDAIALIDSGEEESIQGFTEETEDRLAVVANQHEYSFFVNGRLVNTMYDTEYALNEVGFVIQTLDETYIHVHYDELTIQQLPANSRPPESRPDTVPVNSSFSQVCQGLVSPDNLLSQFEAYTVQPGDSLSAIAQAHGITVEDILHANLISDPSKIFPGETYVIPIGSSGE
jgi:formylglycine-generating enzyme required for sulfatase activity